MMTADEVITNVWVKFEVPAVRCIPMRGHTMVVVIGEFSEVKLQEALEKKVPGARLVGEYKIRQPAVSK